MSGEDRRLLEEWKWKIDELKINLKKAKSIENWEIELKKLKEIYANLN